MTSSQVDNEGIDSAAISAFIAEYGERATALPPLAIVIAAYNEEGAIGPVLDTLPKEVSGLATAIIVLPVLVFMYDPRYALPALPFLCLAAGLAGRSFSAHPHARPGTRNRADAPTPRSRRRSAGERPWQ